MADYWVNSIAQSNGDHEVHEKGCSSMPGDKTYLGNFSTCREAVTEAKRTDRQSNGCYWCARACHSG